MNSPGESSLAQPAGSRCAKCGCLAVLGILAAIAVAAYADLRARMREGLNTNARATCRWIFNAIEQYDMDYDRNPVPAPVSKDMDLLSDNQSGIISALKGMDDTVNPRRKDYLGDIRDAKMVDGEPVGGIWRGKGKSIGIYDPWGQPYFIRLDTDGDGHVEDPSSPGNKVRSPALIWSAGKDGDVSTWSDNVGSREIAR